MSLHQDDLCPLLGKWHAKQKEEFRGGLILLIVVLLMLFGGGGGYYGYRRWGSRGGIGIFGIVLIVLVCIFLFGGLRLPN